MTATEFIEVDANRVLVMVDVRARKLERLEHFFDRARAREAAGLG